MNHEAFNLNRFKKIFKNLCQNNKNESLADEMKMDPELKKYVNIWMLKFFGLNFIQKNHMYKRSKKLAELPWILTITQAVQAIYALFFIFAFLYIVFYVSYYILGGIHWIVSTFKLIFQVIHIISYLFLKFVLTGLIAMVYLYMSAIDIFLSLTILPNPHGYNIFDLIRAVIRIFIYSFWRMIKLVFSGIMALFSIF